jgi:hypothetical protein
MAKKKTDPRTTRKQVEQDLMAIRLDKVNKLVAAKETHDNAVKKVLEDELRDYGKQLDLFMKRAPDLVQMATQVSKLAALPTVKMRKFCMGKEEYVFRASTYRTNYSTQLMCIGATRPREGLCSASYIVIGPDGQWVTNKVSAEQLVHFEELENKTTENRWRPNAKDFMLAALEWEKQLYALVDRL